MKKKDFEAWLEARVTQPVVRGLNTNNAWGFGGACDKNIYRIDAVTVVTGTACYRHARSVKFIRIDLCRGGTSGYGEFDEVQSPKVFDKAVKFLTEYFASTGKTI